MTPPKNELFISCNEHKCFNVIQFTNEVKVVQSQCDVIDQLMRGHDFSNWKFQYVRDNFITCIC